MNRLRQKTSAIVVGLVFGIGIAWAGLETVTHIQDLNASWPLGSDLASTSDDHVRNIKSALKTDFPNFNGTYTSASAPVFAIPNDTNTGMYSSQADRLSFATGGTIRAEMRAGSFDFYPAGTLTASVQANGYYNTDGSAANPSYSFQNSTSTGVYSSAANRLSLSANGAIRMEARAGSIDFYPAGSLTSSIQANGYYNTDSSASSPSYSFQNDSDTGFYRDTNNQIAIALGGSTAGQIAQGSFTMGITGLATSPTATAEYQRIGRVVYIYVPGLSGTSNATSLTLTGLPAVIQAAGGSGEFYVGSVQNNGSVVTDVTGSISSGTPSVITLSRSGSGSGWTNTGNKGITAAGTNFSYMLR